MNAKQWYQRSTWGSSHVGVMLCSYPQSSPLQFPSLNQLCFFHNTHQPKLLTFFHQIRITPSFSIQRIQLVHPFNHSSIGNEQHKLDVDQRNRRLQVQKYVDKIRALPFSTRIQIINLFEKDCGKNHSLSHFNHLLMALVIADELDLALNFYSAISSYGLLPDSSTFSAIIRCHCKKNDFDEAKRILDYMVQMGFKPNVETLTVLINSLCRKGKLQKAFDVIDGIGCERTIQIYNCLIKGLCFVGRVEEAYEMLMNIKGECVEPDIYTYTALMDGFCKVGRTDEAMKLLNEALEIGLEPNVVTFNTFFNGYCKEGRPLEGMGVLKQMKGRNCMPDYISYSTLLHGLLTWNEVKMGLQIYKEMVGVGFDVDDKMMNSLVRGLCREEDLFKDAYEVFEKMKNRNRVVYESTYGPVIEALCSGGKVDEALSVLVLMYEGNCVPGRSTYDILIDEFKRIGAFPVACNVYGAALKQGLFPLHQPLYLVK